MAHICKRCGGQFEDDDVTVVDLESVLGAERHQQAVREGPDRILEESEKNLFSRSDAERTYCNKCYYCGEDQGFHVWERSAPDAA